MRSTRPLAPLSGSGTSARPSRQVFPCGNINPLGITGTPVVDLASRSLFLDAEVSGAGHQIFSLNVDTGAINAGWPVTREHRGIGI